MTRTHFQINTFQEHDAETIARTLTGAGIQVTTVTETTHEQDGVIMTRNMAGLTWDAQTSNDNCDGSCSKEGGPPHRPFTDLSPAQQAIFTDRVLVFMSAHRGNLEMEIGHMRRLGPPRRHHALQLTTP